MNYQEKVEWLENNPTAWKAFKNYAFQVASTGRKFGFKAIAERVRWDSYFSKENEGFKWSNSVTTHAGRKFIELYPQFEDQVSFKEFKSYGNVRW